MTTFLSVEVRPAQAAGLLLPQGTNGLRLLPAPRRKQSLWLTELHVPLTLKMLWKTLESLKESPAAHRKG